MTRRDDLATIRQMLLDRRQALTTTQREVDHELTALREADRDPEYEEGAQVAAAEATLATLHEGHLAEIERIDASLARMDQGDYGTCADCELAIPRERLKVMPYSPLCAECAEQREVGHQHVATL